MNNGGTLLVGGGGHCRSVIDVLESARAPIAGVVHGEGSDEPVLGYPFLGRDEDLTLLRRRFSQAMVTVGQGGNPENRVRLYQLLAANGFILPVVISPFSHVSRHAEVGPGTIVMHHAVVNAGARVGENSIVNTKALVEHDCLVGNHCHIAVGAVVCGGVRIGARCFIGAGAVVHPAVTIGDGCVIGMGACVFNDVPSGKTIVGFKGSQR